MAALDLFSPAVRDWFEASFPEPTPPQKQGWPAIAAGDHTLILAPTGSGKTLSAFLWGIDRLIQDPTDPDDPHTRIIYVSPLRALAIDVDKNLQSPLAGIASQAETDHRPTVGVRTGDTTQQQRRRIAKHPPDILITTPESLYLMLTSQARDALRRVDAVIIDEIHALAGSKRGAHLSLSLERLQAINRAPIQRIGLSATQRPLEETARFLGGRGGDTWRPVTIVDAGIAKELDIEIIVPIDDMADLGQDSAAHATPGPAASAEGGARRSIWPSIHPHLLDLIEAHTSTLVFVNNRRLAERLATRLNELAIERRERSGIAPSPFGEAADSATTSPGGPNPAINPDEPDLVKAHHGSISREQRLVIEDQLKSGTLKGLVATSSLELGIDMGAVDLVVQIESPGAVSRGLQRIGRAGHNVGDISRGKVFPKHRADLLEAAVVSQRMQAGLIESTHFLRNPLDVLAQQIVAMSAMDDWKVADLARVVRGSANFAELDDGVLRSVLDLLGGRYPSEKFAELRPRIVWDRVDDEVRGRRGVQRLAVTNPGTIPDRGLFGVFLADGTRVGELDEEMVYESRPGEVFLLGASSWRIDEITFDRVVVTPAAGVDGRMPFWRGDGPGRPIELGEALGEFTRQVRAEPDPVAWLAEHANLDALAGQNLVNYLDDQQRSTGAVPDDRTVVVERFRDEIGDWRVCLHTPFGAQVHAPWAMAIRARAQQRYGIELEMIWSDDGIVLRMPAGLDTIGAELFTFDPAAIAQIVIDELPRTALFASRFREAAGRALLLPRRRPGKRTPLWQQRQRAADLLDAARDFPDFPIVLETIRECVNDVFDLDALRKVLTGIADGSIHLITVDTPKASPFAQSMLFGWIAVYMYEGDAPLAERRAAALTLDRDLLTELLGAEELRELLDPSVLADVELELQRLTDERAARDPDELHDALRALGPLSMLDLRARSAEPEAASAWAASLVEAGRAFETEVAGEVRYVAAEDLARIRDGLGAVVPDGLASVFYERVERPLQDLVERYARTHGPFLTAQVAHRFGLEAEPVAQVLGELQAEGVLVRGEFRPDGVEREWCDKDVLRRLRRQSLAKLRAEVEPVDGSALARFLPTWQGIDVPRRGLDGLVDVIGVLQGAPIPASVLERDVLAARMDPYSPALLDQLCTAGEVIWLGAGSIGNNDGRIALLFRDQAALLAPPAADPITGPHHEAIRGWLDERGASFWPELVQACVENGLSYGDDDVFAALWDLVWNGEITNDSLAPLRAVLDHKPAPRPRPSPRPDGVRGAARQGARSRARLRTGPRPRPGRLSATGPPAASGRWSLVAPLLAPTPSPTAASHARAMQLLERYGVLTREAALGEGNQGGFAGVYPVLRVLEEQGKVRRGYFVAGLGAAQFALAGAVDRLRRAPPTMHPTEHPTADPATYPTPDPAIHVLAATDPAQPFGAALPWPSTEQRPSRSAGALVVIADGHPLVFVERGAKSLISFPHALDSPAWAHALAEAASAKGLRPEITRIDGRPAGESPLVAHLEAAGFARGYKGWTLH